MEPFYNNIEERNYAAYLGRKFFKEELYMWNILDQYPIDSKDLDIRELYNLMSNKPKKQWLFGISKIDYQKYLENAFCVIDKLECK